MVTVRRASPNDPDPRPRCQTHRTSAHPAHDDRPAMNTRHHRRTFMRDHPELNPYLRNRGIAVADRPVYWHPRRPLLEWFTHTGATHCIPVTTSALFDWIAEREPHQLWEPWRDHLRDQRVLVEHTSVNPVHPLHLGSMRGTVIGSTLAEMLRCGGADVQTRYFVNDLGRQVRTLERAATAARLHNIPAGLRHDHAVGVLYAFANMTLARRTNDLDRLIAAHPWLPDVVDVGRPLPDQVPDPHLIEDMVDSAVD
ncbi:MAG: arginine--tRNA ligase, partial [Mycobacteriaceae bacterium]|nr:arginine--tRNA ligase [Mycobacteriaceae bacterium]